MYYTEPKVKSNVRNKNNFCKKNYLKEKYVIPIQHNSDMELDKGSLKRLTILRKKIR